MSDRARRVLLVEDDAHLVEILRLHLQGEGYALTTASDGRHGLSLVERGGWDAIVLDLMLPGIDGLEICRRARDLARWTPIIITSARGSEVHRILGLEMGADDYLAKPFSVLELLARLKALLRRVDAIAQGQGQQRELIEADGLHLDRLARQVLLHGRPVELTPREFDLLQHFAQHPERVFTRSELLNRIWGLRHDGYEHTVNTHINRLRGKIEADPRRPQRIVTVWGLGYKFCRTAAGPAGPAADAAAGGGPAPQWAGST
jgi:two-component system OmpR family response regulator